MRNAVIAALGAAIGGLVLSAGCAGGAGSTPGEASTTPPDVAIVGSWRPVSIAGYVPPAGDPNAYVAAPITFDGQHRLHGTDGCNRFDLTYRVTRDGSFSVSEGAMTAIGCANVPNDQVTARARRVVVDGGVLTFFDGTGQLLGRYQRIGPASGSDLGRPSG